MVVARLPHQTPIRTLNDAILAAIRTLADHEIDQAVVILEPDRIRLRRRSPSTE